MIRDSFSVGCNQEFVAIINRAEELLIGTMQKAMELANPKICSAPQWIENDLWFTVLDLRQ